jgi:PIN domain nuclease of toxin-antitoxin system
VLLDSHALVFAAVDPSKLGTSVQRLVRSKETEVHVNVVSLWELLLKAEGKLRIGEDPVEELKTVCRTLRVRILTVTAEHVLESVRL